jgi:folylpolyglutamate synthase/dihydropteroate synthase
MKKFAPKAFVADNASLALKKAKSMLNEKDVLIITGSLYLIGECTAIIDDIF